MTLHKYKEKTTLIKTTLVLVFFFLIANSISLSFLSRQIFAQAGGVDSGETLGTNPKTRNPVITATVPDIIPPSAPFLIYPEDDALTNDGTPTFIWQQSTDNVAVSYYQMYLDGTLLFDNIPITSTSNSFYELNFDSITGQYSLTPASIINDGLHTWSISVYDDATNSNTSATWSFTIDTLAPTFLITSIGSIPTNISAQDIESIPVDTIELEDNSPIFLGTGEANSSVQVTVIVPDESNQIINFTIDASGNWNFQLGMLPRNKIITLNFIITDPATNISVITNLKILIIQDYIVIPPTAPPTFTPAPIPPTTSIFTPIPIPPATPIIEIPILPPEEIFNNIIKKIQKLTPEPILNIIIKAPETIQTAIIDIIKAILPIGAMITTIAIPVISFFSLLLRLGQQFSWQLILKILQALGLLPPQKPQGLVYNSDNNKPVSFALLTITSTNKELEQQIIETAITDVDGIYQGIQLPHGKYVINVSHQDYRFPTSKQKPKYLTIQEFYRGETFQLDSTTTQPLFLIPVDKLVETEVENSFKKTMRKILQKIKFTDFFWPLFLISTIITILYPTVINLVILGFYILVLLKRSIKSFHKPNIYGYVLNINESPVENAIIRINNSTNSELVSILTTNSDGYFSTFLEPNVYQIQINKTGFVWVREGSQLSFEEIDVTTKRAGVRAIMKSIGNL